MRLLEKTLATWLACTIAASSTSLGQTCTQSADSSTIILGNARGCVAPGTNTTRDNSYYRRFRPGTDCSQPGPLTVSSVTFGVEGAISPSGSQNGQVRIFSIPESSPLLLGNLTLLADQSFTVTNGLQFFQQVILAHPAGVNTGSDIVVEIFVEEGPPLTTSFFIGSNDAGETGPSYLKADICGVTEPTELATLGFPLIHTLIEIGFGPGQIGTSYCSAVPNSSGNEGQIAAIGSSDPSENDVTLQASSLPSNQFGIFVCSRLTAFVPGANGSSNGNLCLDGPIGRFNRPGEILATGANGEFSLALNLSSIPQGNGVVTVVAGQSWSFQAWHRDGVGLGSNFTDGVTVSFQ